MIIMRNITTFKLIIQIIFTVIGLLFTVTIDSVSAGEIVFGITNSSMENYPYISNIVAISLFLLVLLIFRSKYTMNILSSTLNSSVRVLIVLNLFSIILKLTMG